MNNFTKLIASYLVKPKMKLLDWVCLDKLNYNLLTENPNSIHILKQFRGIFSWECLSKNTHSIAIHLLEQNIDKIDWELLSANPNAIHLLEQNIDKIEWANLSINPTPEVFHLLEQNMDKINWELLSEIQILKYFIY